MNARREQWKLTDRLESVFFFDGSQQKLLRNSFKAESTLTFAARQLSGPPFDIPHKLD